MSTVDEAIIALRRGGIVAYPTEAVYGLGCDPFCESAVERLLTLKNRPMSKGLIVLAPDVTVVKRYIRPIAETRWQAVLASWPGPHTWILPVNELLPPWIKGEHDSVAMRITAHPIASTLVQAWGNILISTSANVSSEPPARTFSDVGHVFTTGIDVIIDGAVGGALQPTIIRDAITGAVLRQ